LKFDYASQRPNGDQQGQLKKLSVEKGILREIEGVSRLTGALLKCKVRPVFRHTDVYVKFFLGDLSNDITLTAFRLLVSDLLALFQPLNEGVMNVLSMF
jgi:phosphatidylinositol-binding clathrin assembly protein